MKNPLEPEEKGSLTELLEHDTTHVLATLVQDAYGEAKGFVSNFEPGERFIYLNHLSQIYDSIQILKLTVISNFDRLNHKNIEEILENLVEFLTYKNVRGVTYLIQVDRDFQSFDSLIYSALYNLVKNAKQFTKPEDRKISVNVSQFSGIIPIADYISHEMSLEGDFIKFNVNDNGKGFPPSVPKSDFLKFGVSTSGKDRGFGLYYVSLVCKFLRSHLAIDSKPGDTNVTIYHPLTLK